METYSAIWDAFSEFGKVYNISSGLFSGTTCFNGIKYISMEKPLTNIPSLFTIGDTRVRVFYPGQVQTCFRCSSVSHLAHQCPSITCFKCKGRGHLQMNCTSSWVTVSTPIINSNPWTHREADTQATDLPLRRVEDSGVETLGSQWQQQFMESMVNLTDNFGPTQTCDIGTNTDWSGTTSISRKVGAIDVEKRHVKFMCKPENTHTGTQVKIGTKTNTRHCQTDTPSLRHRYSQSKRVTIVDEATATEAIVLHHRESQATGQFVSVCTETESNRSIGRHMVWWIDAH